MGVCVAGSAVAALATEDDTVLLVMALAASGAKEVDASKENTRRRRVMLSASLNSGVLNAVCSPSPLAVGIAVLLLDNDGDVLSALLT